MTMLSLSTTYKKAVVYDKKQLFMIKNIDILDFSGGYNIIIMHFMMYYNVYINMKGKNKCLQNFHLHLW